MLVEEKAQCEFIFLIRTGEISVKKCFLNFGNQQIRENDFDINLIKKRQKAALSEKETISLHTASSGEFLCEEVFLNKSRLAEFSLCCSSTKAKVYAIPVKIIEYLPHRVVAELKQMFDYKHRFRMDLIQKYFRNKVKTQETSLENTLFLGNKKKTTNLLFDCQKSSGIKNYQSFFRSEQSKLNQTVENLKLLTSKYIKINRFAIARACFSMPKKKITFESERKKFKNKINENKSKAEHESSSFIGNLIPLNEVLRKKNEKLLLIKKISNKKIFSNSFFLQKSVHQ